MRKVGLTVYGLSFINGEEKLELHDFYDGKSLLDIVEKFAIENKNNVSNDPENESIFLFEKVERKEIISTEGKEEYELLFGRVKTGEYGIESELLDITNGNIYKRKENQADMLPFGFCIAVPKGKVTQAIIILQTIGNYGMKVALQRKISECIDGYDLSEF